MPKAIRRLRDENINRQDLERLLLRLDPDPTRAGEKYEFIWSRLAKFFEWNHCTEPEALADEVFNRVASKLGSEEIREVDQYAIGIARFVCLEAHRKMEHEDHIEDLPGGGNALSNGHDLEEEIVDKINKERRRACLEPCLAKLGPDERKLLLLFYSAGEERQIPFRKKLARIFGITVENLRVRACRIRARLETCVTICLESAARTRSGLENESQPSERESS
jgi:DNA-directed RNA polymerase specialized sigma24 family protein